jgi:hypothetical protein
MDWSTYFDWIPVVNLARRPERWASFLARWKQLTDWPFIQPEQFIAVDGEKVKPPTWFKAGRGAWGCAQSHMQIFERALASNCQRILVLEDDVVFGKDFVPRLLAYLQELPVDWQQAYVGGQHLRQRVRKPVVVSPQVLRAFNVNRTHAYAMQRSMFQPMLDWLKDEKAWARTPGLHVDHHMGTLHERGQHGIYTPRTFLAGQEKGMSDITHHECPERFWQPAVSEVAMRVAPGPIRRPSTLPARVETAADMPPFVAIVGLHRSGSSMLAWILQRLGVHMGNKLNGNCEASGLQRLCEALYPFGKTTPVGNMEVARTALATFVRDRTVEAARMRTLPGGKYPHLCAMRDLLLPACKWGLRIIHIDRPYEDSVASLVTRVREDRAKGIKWLGIPDEQAREVQKWLHDHKSEYFDGKIPAEHILHVDYYETMKQPQKVIEKVVQFLKLKPTPVQLMAAAQAVQPKRLRHLNGKYIGGGAASQNLIGKAGVAVPN